MYIHRLMFVFAPALEVAAPIVFMDWLRPCAKASTYTQENTNTDHSQTSVCVQVGLEPTILCQKHFILLSS